MQCLFFFLCFTTWNRCFCLDADILILYTKFIYIILSKSQGDLCDSFRENLQFYVHTFCFVVKLLCTYATVMASCVLVQLQYGLECTIWKISNSHVHSNQHENGSPSIYFMIVTNTNLYFVCQNRFLFLPNR